MVLFSIRTKEKLPGCLSGFVPFCQVSDNKHKPMIEQSPPSARTKLYYKSRASRNEAKHKMELIAAETHLRMDNPSLDDLDDYAPDVFGIYAPEPLVREAYIMRPDLSPVFGWETGRRSEPFSMDMSDLKGSALPIHPFIWQVRKSKRGENPQTIRM